ncbi:hypothetical protein TNCV_1359291 [Trichonephila clavipes]|nr:hypothetical protein TNCV_1359291 [Trichonephila clavipes]
MNVKRLSRKEDFQKQPKKLHRERWGAKIVPQDTLYPFKNTICFGREFASDPECVVNNSSEIQFASFRNFVVIHSIFRASSPRISESPVYFKERPASDPKCVVIHSSEDQFASFKIFAVIHSVFSSVVIEGQRIAS